MPRWWLALFAALALAPEARAYSFSEASPPRLELISFTGQLQLQMPSGGGPPAGATPSIPPGSEVTVIAGRALLQSGDTFIRAGAGDSFRFSLAPSGAHEPAGIEIAATGGSTALDIEVGSARALVRSEGARHREDRDPWSRRDRRDADTMAHPRGRGLLGNAGPRASSAPEPSRRRPRVHRRAGPAHRRRYAALRATRLKSPLTILGNRVRL